MKELREKFMGLNKLVRVILLVIPFVNWIVEIIVRWSFYLEKKDTGSLIMALVATFFFGNFLGWLDAIFTLIEDKLILTDLEVK